MHCPKTIAIYFKIKKSENLFNGGNSGNRNFFACIRKTPSDKKKRSVYTPQQTDLKNCLVSNSLGTYPVTRTAFKMHKPCQF